MAKDLDIHIHNGVASPSIETFGAEGGGGEGEDVDLSSSSKKFNISASAVHFIV